MPGTATLPYTLANGTLADATQVMADLVAINANTTSETNVGWFNVKNPAYAGGATGNGTTDDSAAIQACFAAATAAGGGGALMAGGPVVYFPPGTYYYNSATPISITPAVSVFAAGGAVIVGGPLATSDCFDFPAGEVNDYYDYTDYALPSVYNFPLGAAIHLPGGIAYARIRIPSIRSCQAVVKCVVNSTNTGAIYNSSVDFHVADNCTYAVWFKSSYSSNDTIQGIHVRGNTWLNPATANGNPAAWEFDGLSATTNAAFVIPAVGSSVSVSLAAAYNGQNNDQIVITDGTHTFVGLITAGAGTATLTVKNNSGIYFGSSAGYAGQTMATSASVNAHYASINANFVDIGDINAPQAGSVAVRYNGGVYTGNSLRCVLNWGNFYTASFQANVSGSHDMANTIEIAGDYIPLNNFASYAGARNIYPGFDSGTRFRFTPAYIIGVNGTEVAAVTTQGATGASNFASPLASAPGGSYIISNRLRLTFAISALAAGAVQDWYAYSPYALGNRYAIRAQIIEALASSTTGIVLTVAEDETLEAGTDGNTYPGQLHFQFKNIGSASYTGTVRMNVEVGAA